jgi:outer membrane biosynthesis protein TonB
MRRTVFAGALALAPLIMLTGISAQADEWDKHTLITVDRSIEVPGTVLPAGKYVFRLLDSPSDRHVVQVFNERQDHLMATVIAIPNYRLEPTGDTVLSFYEVPAGQPQPVRAWFYPGDNYGQEFVYSKNRSIQLSQNTAPAPPAPAAEPAPPAPAPTVAAAPPEPAPEPSVAAPEPAPAPQIAANEPPPAPAPVQEPAPATPVMPQTASNIPLLALIGLLSIGLASGLSFFAKRLS